MSEAVGLQRPDRGIFELALEACDQGEPTERMMRAGAPGAGAADRAIGA